MDINQIKLDNKFKLVEASAGTGKSFTLAHLVLRNVLEKKIKPDEILLLSFTKNTCSELRDKILSRFQDLKLYLQNHDESKIDNTLKDWYLKFKEKEKSKEKTISEIDNFVNEIYKLQVTTFHAFCNNIIDEYSIEIGVTQDPYVENNIDNLYKDVIDNLWIDVFLNLNPSLISAINKKKISSRFGSRINKSFFVEILKNIDQENIYKFQINNKYKAFAIKTDLLGCFDDPVNTVIEYCKGIVEKNDILTIGESPLAIMQNRYISPQNLEYSLFSKALCYFFHPTSSLATACGMQLLINKIGVTRITLALFVGFLFKLVGIKGMFYRLTGSESSLIDDISGTVTPYDKSIVMGPLNADLFCKEVSNYLNIDVAVVDVNDLGGVKVLASSNKKVNKILKKNLISNPAGNGDEKTPIVLIREKK